MLVHLSTVPERMQLLFSSLPTPLERFPLSPSLSRLYGMRKLRAIPSERNRHFAWNDSRLSLPLLLLRLLRLFLLPLLVLAFILCIYTSTGRLLAREVRNARKRSGEVY